MTWERAQEPYLRTGATFAALADLFSLPLPSLEIFRMVSSGQSRVRPQRLLMTGDALGGVWTYALELTRCLEQYDIEVDLAIMGAPLTKTQQQEAAAIDNLIFTKVLLNWSGWTIPGMILTGPANGCWVWNRF